MIGPGAGVDAGADAPAGPDPEALWRDAEAAAQLLAVDPIGLGGIWLRAGAGPLRALWVERFSTLWRAAGGAADPAERPAIRRLPAHTGADRLLGGLDLTATLAGGRPRHQDGILAEIDGGALLAPMAERLGTEAVGPLAAALDRGAVPRPEGEGAQPARFALIALDEGDPEDAEDRLAPALAERLGLWLRLAEAPEAQRAAWAAAPPLDADRVRAARALLSEVETPEAAATALLEGAAAIGVPGGRPDLFAARVARAAAALAGRRAVAAEDLALAGRLALGPRATQRPTPPEPETADSADAPEPPETAAEDPPSEPDRSDPPGDPDPEEALADDGLAETVTEAAATRLPLGLLEALSNAARAPGGAAPKGGAAGARRVGLGRGRAVGSRPGLPGGGARLDLLATLRAAAPWKKLRGGGAARGEGPLLPIRLEDLRVARTERPAETLIVFAVDASGSTALSRLGEAKGAVELLLAESYARRDQVALVTFRGAKAELALPPTRSLARAKRLLSGLPGGGGTPLALGLDAARLAAEQGRRAGREAMLVVLTDGQANVARDGAGGRARAAADAAASARAIAAAGIGALLIDASPRPRPQAAEIAAAMRARYLPLPRADAKGVSHAVSEAVAAARG